MEKPVLSEDQYIAELNRALQEHPNYQEGMAFVAYPEGATEATMSGYAFVGALGHLSLFAHVAHQVSERVILCVTPRQNQ